MEALDIQNYLESLDVGGIAVFVKTLEQGYLAINRSGAATFDKVPNEMIGGHDPEYFDASSAQQVIERDQNIIQKSRTSIYESVVQIHGDWTRFKTAKFPVTLKSGEVVILGISLGFKTRADEKQVAMLEEAALKIQVQPQDFIGALLLGAPMRLPR